MSVDQYIFIDGHIAPQLLREFAEEPEGFHDDIVEEVWLHLDACPACIEAYEAIRDGHEPDKRDSAEEQPAQPSPVVESVADTRAFDPDDLKSVRPEDFEQDNDDHINGLMPVGDDPARNGLPDEYRNGDRPTTVTVDLESSIDSAQGERSDSEPKADDDDNSGDDNQDARRKVLKAPEIDGLITGEVHAIDEEADKLVTETAVEASARIKQERAEIVDLPDIGEGDQQSSDAQGEAPEPSVDEPVVKDVVADIAREEADEDPFIDPVVEGKPPPKTVRPKPSPRRAPAATAKKPEPLEDLLNGALAFLSRPRNAIIVGSAVLLVAAAIVFAVFFAGSEQERLNAGWEPLDVIKTRTPLQEVIIRRMHRGSIQVASGADVTLDFRGVDRLVIAVDLDFIKGKTSPHELIVRNPEGLNVFQEPIPQIYLDDGRFFLRLVPKQFDMGQMYKLELITHRADQSVYTVAESVFDVVK
jgi:hypothetical protein